MVHLERIAYVRLGASDLETSAAFARDVLGLQPVERDARTAHFRSDDRHHTLTYVAGDPADHAVGFELRYDDDLAHVAAQVERAGHAVREGAPWECEERHVERFVAFDDPTGNHIELAVRPHESPRRYFASRDAGITGFSHIGLRTTGARRDEAFWTQVLDARVSDWIGDAPLLRVDPVHHSLALFPSAFAGVQHVNHQVASIDDVMRAYYFLRERGIRIRFGPGRHATSGAVFCYFEGPDGMTYEYSSGVSMIHDEAGHRPRQFPFVPESFCVWGAKPDIPEFRKDAIALELVEVG
jgi:2,3-dihydroxy-p-cumate/2,3-dihydroxybenzoate 3,4-dioxygenase